MIKVLCVCGARPNFMKIAPLVRAFEKRSVFEILIVHTGQHYDDNMSKQFFHDLDIPMPDINLEIGSGSHAVQTATIMLKFEPVVEQFNPDYVLVVGDVNSTIACGLVAVKMGIRLIHVEAGQRSFDRSMPEEINRIVTDALSDLLFVSEPSGVTCLQKEGIASEKIHFTGNIMIDTLLGHLDKAMNSSILSRLNLTPKDYGVVTLHRPSNVDSTQAFEIIFMALEEIQRKEKIVFPMHPRTRKNIEQSEKFRHLLSMENLLVVEPLGYLDFLCLMNSAAVVMTDSGGIQEETTALGVPCMTLRTTTEWPITLTEGTNHLIPLTTNDIVQNYHKIRRERNKTHHRLPQLWDGKAAERIIEVIINDYKNQK